MPLARPRYRFPLAPALCTWLLAAPPVLAQDEVAGELRLLDDDGAWSWFEGERCAMHGDTLLVGTVSMGSTDPDRRGDVNLIVHDLASGTSRIVELADQLEADDHDSPAILVLPDGRLLTVYAKHGNDSHVRVRRSIDATWSGWDEERVLAIDTEGRGVTYSNVYRLPDGDLLDFFRGRHWNPHVIRSRDDGATWGEPLELLGGPGRPYMRYVSDGRGAVHFVCSEQHPRNFDTGIRHGVLRDGVVHTSAGARIALLSEGSAPVDDLTLVFQGTPETVAWCNDIRLDSELAPVVVYSVQLDGKGLPPGQGGLAHEYRRAHWNGERWIDRRVAHAGQRLYAGEDDYTGLIVLDPGDTDTVVFSTDADPRTGAPLVSEADGARHHELFRARTGDAGETWAFEALTRDSSVDNLRPVIAASPGRDPVLVWLRGSYSTYQDFDLAVVALTLPEQLPRLEPVQPAAEDTER